VRERLRFPDTQVFITPVHIVVGGMIFLFLCLAVTGCRRIFGPVFSSLSHFGPESQTSYLQPLAGDFKFGHLEVRGIQPPRTMGAVASCFFLALRIFIDLLQRDIGLR